MADAAAAATTVAPTCSSVTTISSKRASIAAYATSMPTHSQFFDEAATCSVETLE